MAGPKPMQTEFGIHYRLESCAHYFFNHVGFTFPKGYFETLPYQKAFLFLNSYCSTTKESCDSNRIDTGMMTKLGLDWTPTHQELAITTLDSLGQHFGPWLHAGKLIFNSWLLPSLEQLL